MLRICSLLVLFALPVSAETGFSGPVHVVDGDTIHVGDVTVRLQGIDAPEAGQKCGGAGGAGWDCGDWVSAQVRERYEGREASCRFIETDAYGRAVAVCSVDGRDIGRDLVRDGLAFAYRKYSMRYDLDEKGAAVAGRGLHAVDITPPAEHRAAVRAVRTQRSVAAAPEGCVIKGNISQGSGKRIYHEPGQRHYAKTVITEARGERWFCSAAEAEAAGWRRARI